MSANKENRNVGRAGLGNGKKKRFGRHSDKENNRGFNSQKGNPDNQKNEAKLHVGKAKTKFVKNGFQNDLELKPLNNSDSSTSMLLEKKEGTFLYKSKTLYISHIQ